MRGKKAMKNPQPPFYNNEKSDQYYTIRCLTSANLVTTIKFQFLYQMFQMFSKISMN